MYADTQGNKYYDGFKKGSVMYKLKEFAYIITPGNKDTFQNSVLKDRKELVSVFEQGNADRKIPSIAQLLSFFQSPSGKKFVQCRWFYRPSDTLTVTTLDIT